MSTAPLVRGTASSWIPAIAVALPYAGIAATVVLAEPAPPETLPLALAIALISLGALLRPFEPTPGEKLSLAAAIAFFGVLVLPGAQAVGAVAVAELLARITRRTSAISTVVNVAKAVGAAGAAAAAVGSLRLSTVPAPDLLEVLVAGALYLVATLVPVAAMVAWTRGGGSVAGFFGRETLPMATLIAIGALGAAVWSTSPFLIVLLVLPLATVEVAGRGAARLREAHAALGRALEAQRAFVADAAHELRNPLAAIRGNLAFVRESPLAPDEAAALADARRQLVQLAALVERLLVLSKADANAERGATADLGIIARAVSEATRRRPEVALELEIQEGVQVEVSPELLEALLRDLVGNAAAYTERGSIHVSVRTRAGHGELEVRDTGVGIPPADLPRVFDRFYRGQAARRLAPGSGLGLAIARRIAESQGGSIDLAPARGGGTSVRVRLPLVRRSA